MVNTRRSFANKPSVDSRFGLHSDTWEKTHGLLEYIILTSMPSSFSRKQLYHAVKSFNMNLNMQTLYYHLEGRSGSSKPPVRRTRIGFISEGVLKTIKIHERKYKYAITKDRPYSDTLGLARLILRSKVFPLVYDLRDLPRKDLRFPELVQSYQLNSARGWKIKGRFDSDLQLVVLKHMLRAIFLSFVESDENIVESKCTRKLSKLDWALDPIRVAEPGRIRRMSEKNYATMIARVRDHLGINSIPSEMTHVGAAFLIDLEQLFATLRTTSGRRVLYDALSDSSEGYKNHVRHHKDIHEPLTYPKPPNRTWLRNT
jgi:hypothetical protein